VKIRSEESQQVNQVVNGDLTVTGNILGPQISLLRATVDRIKIALNGLRTPVAGEPSLGTPHTHRVQLTAAVPANNNVQTLSLVGIVPVGTTQVALIITIAAAVANNLIIWANAAGTLLEGLVRAQVVNVYNDAFVLCAVDSGLNIYYQTSARATTLGMTINMTRYWS